MSAALCVEVAAHYAYIASSRRVSMLAVYGRCEMDRVLVNYLSIITVRCEDWIALG